MPRGANGHLVAKHVAKETERGFDLVFHIVMMFNQVIYRALKLVTMAFVSFSRPFFQQ